jgi:hypothetical protein
MARLNSLVVLNSSAQELPVIQVDPDGTGTEVTDVTKPTYNAPQLPVTRDTFLMKK